jgi:hypothetical protein
MMWPASGLRKQFPLAHACALTRDLDVFLDQLLDGAKPLKAASALIVRFIDGQAWCWGSDEDGQIGGPKTYANGTIARVVEKYRFTSISSNSGHTVGMIRFE